MKRKLLSLIAASVALSGVAFAGSPSSYQVTGPVTAVDDTMITVMKGKEKFEVARDSSTKVTGDLKVGGQGDDHVHHDRERGRSEERWQDGQDEER
jgi:hypothetical protein